MAKAQQLKMIRKAQGMTRRESDRTVRQAFDAMRRDNPRQQFWWIDKQGVTGTSGTPYNKSREIDRRRRQLWHRRDDIKRMSD